MIDKNQVRDLLDEKLSELEEAVKSRNSEEVMRIKTDTFRTIEEYENLLDSEDVNDYKSEISKRTRGEYR